MRLSFLVAGPAAPTSNRFKVLIKGFALTSGVALAGLAVSASDADASRWFISGDTIYHTGGTTADDPATLRNIMSQAQQEGVNIRRVVLRNGPGGAATGGVEMGLAIREFGLDTVFDGGCFSACTAAYIGGVNRYFTDYDLATIAPRDVTTFGIHGASAGSPVAVPLSNEEQQPVIDHYHDLLGPETWAVAGDRIVMAITELTDSQGFLNYLDPSSSASTTFCPSIDRSATGNCTAFPGVTLLTDGIATSGQYFNTNDRIFITDTVSNPFQTGMETTLWYRSAFEFLADTEEIDLFNDFDRTDDPSFGNRSSVVAVTPGGHWNLDSSLTVPHIVVDGGKMTLGANAVTHDLDGLGVRNGGTLVLDGGNVSGTLVASNRSLITGRGSIGATAVLTNSDFLPHEVTLRPYSEVLMAPNGRFESLRTTPMRLALGRATTLAESSNLIINVNHDATRAPLTLEQARYFTVVDDELILKLDLFEKIFEIPVPAKYLVSAHRKAMLEISPESNLLLNFNPGYYGSNQRINLVQGVIDNTALTAPTAICNAADTPLFCGTLTEETLSGPLEVESNFINGRFMTAGRAGEPDSLVDTSEDGAVIHARHNSLLTFNLYQNANDIYLTANPAFEDVGLFGNNRSGNGLGEVLKIASWDDETTLAPVLGPLQFSDRNIARREASTLRGDGHSSLRLVSRSLIDQFSDALFSARQNPIDPALSNPLIAAEAQAMSGDRQDRIGMGGGLIGEANLMATDTQPSEAAPRSPFDMDTPTRVFAAGFGQTGKLQGQHRISRLEYNGFGALIGASRQVNENARFGAAIGYGKTNTNARPANSFSADTDTVLGAVYADFNHGRGTSSVQAGYARMSHDTTRNIFDIEGLEAVSKTDYDNNAYFARLESAWDLGVRKGTQITLLAPVVDYINLEGGTVDEVGLSPANLRFEADKLESLRAGLGLHVERKFELGQSGVTPYARVVYQREFMDSEATSTNRFRLATQLPFDSVSRELGEDSVEWNLGLRSTTRNDKLNLAVEYQGRAIKGETGHGAQISLKYHF